MTKFSPGPWSTGADEDAHIVYDENLYFVADTGRDDGNAELERANAQAISALPELLEALQMFVDQQILSSAVYEQKYYMRHGPDEPLRLGRLALASLASASQTGSM